MEILSGAVSEAKRSGNELAVAILDLDGFKSVNDTLGHAAGDLLLQHVADRLLASAGPAAKVARMGGDEFAVLLPDADDQALIRDIAQRMLDGVVGAASIYGEELKVTVSIGLSRMPFDGEHEEELLKRADAAMYEAKKRGKNQYCLES